VIIPVAKNGSMPKRIDLIDDFLRVCYSAHADFGAGSSGCSDCDVADSKNALPECLSHGCSAHILDPDFLLDSCNPTADYDDP